MDDDVDSLVKMAVLHYQFEAIHPFSDGNGRTGRILNILYLVQNNLLDVPILFLSNYIIRNKTSYYKGLQDITESQTWEGWILYMLKAIETTSYKTIARIDAIRISMREYKEKMKQKLPGKIYTKNLLEVLFEQPYCTIQSLEKRDIVKGKAASSYIKKLSELGLLSPMKIGRN